MFKAVFVVVCCFSLFVNVSAAEIPAEQVQKIEAAVPCEAFAAPRQGRKLLVFTLCRGYKHSSIPYATKALQLMGEKTGAFEVIQSRDVSVLQRDSLRQFDAICLNNTTRLEFEEPGLREGLIDFVKSGKGIVGIHAASDAFYTWPEGAEMIGGLFDGHPWHEAVYLKLEAPGQPLCSMFGKDGFGVTDEIYQFKQPYSRDKLKVLLSLDVAKTNMNKQGIHRQDSDFAVSWVHSYGKGRVFYCSLGHDHEIFWNPTILKHYLAGIQFALGDLQADTTPSALNIEKLDTLLAQIATYDYGQSRERLTEITEFARKAYSCPSLAEQVEQRFIRFLASDATFAGKQFICKRLSIIGTERAVGTLAGMLTDAKYSDMARYALERIGGEAVNEALREALPKAAGLARIGIINSLGECGDKQAVEALAAYIHDADSATAQAAVAALGKIGGERAANLLDKALSRATGKIRKDLSVAYLLCAGRFLERGYTNSALGIYRQLYSGGEAAPTRIAAFRGFIIAAKAAGRQVTDEMLQAITGEDQPIQVAAIAMVRDVADTPMVKELSRQLPQLPAELQVQLLSALADHGDSAALPAVVEAADSGDDSVRIEALAALRVLGGAGEVNLLARTAAKSKALEQQTARDSLYRLRGPEVDRTIVTAIAKGDPDVQVELIRSVEQRNIVDAVETLLQTAGTGTPNVKIESLKVLQAIARADHLPALVKLLVSEPDQLVRSQAENAIAAVAVKIPQGQNRAAVVLGALRSARRVPDRCSLLGVLGKIGDDKGLPALRSALQDRQQQVREAAIRALSQWHNDKAADDLLGVAQSTDNPVHRALALRGLVRLLGLGSDRPAARSLEMYSQAMELAADVNEKKMVLSGLANTKEPGALQMAATYLADENLNREAAAAVVKIAAAIHSSHPQPSKEALQKVLEVSQDDALRKQAQELMGKIK